MAEDKKDKKFVTKGWINLSKNNPNVSIVTIDSKVIGFIHNSTLLGYAKGEKQACPIKASVDTDEA